MYWPQGSAKYSSTHKKYPRGSLVCTYMAIIWRSRTQLCSQILVIIGVINLPISMLLLVVAASLFLSIPVQITFAQEDQQPPFMESGRPPIEGWTLPGPGQMSIEVASSEGDVIVAVTWTLAEIGQPNKFSFQFADKEGNTISPTYSIELLQSNKTVPGSLRQEQTSPVQEYIFSASGIYTLRIYGIQDRPASDVINIPLEVTAQQPPPPPSTSGNTTRSYQP
jgi:hypothetical protein